MSAFYIEHLLLLCRFLPNLTGKKDFEIVPNNKYFEIVPDNKFFEIVPNNKYFTCKYINKSKALRTD